MAQQRFIEFKDNISSFNANRKYGGIIPAAAYRGFDLFTGAANLTFTLAHTGTGNIFLNQDLSNTSPMGIWVTKQGGVIMEDAALSLAIQTNVGNAFQRIDAIIGRHSHDIVSVGGLPATYEVVKGATGGPVAPTPSGVNWVIIGYLTIAANAAVTSTATYKRVKVPGLGNKNNALLDEDNLFSGQNQENQGASLAITSQDFEITARGVLTSLPAGNSFVVISGGPNLDLLPDAPDGTKVQLIFNAATTIRPYVNQLVGGTAGSGTRAGYLAGYRPIVVRNSEISGLSIAARQTVTFIKVLTSHAFSSGDPVYGDYWQVLSVSDVPARVATAEATIATTNTTLTSLQTQINTLTTLLNNVNPVKSIKWIYYTGLISTEFDSTGLAKSTSQFLNYAICNGQNGTPSALGKVFAGYDPTNPNFDTIGQLGGEETHTLIQAELPNVRLRMFSGAARIGALGTFPDNVPAWTSSHALGNQDYDMQAAGDTNASMGQTSPMGSSSAHNNLQPYVVLLPIMRVV